MHTNNSKALGETRAVIEIQIKAASPGRREQLILWGSFQSLQTIHCMKWSTGLMMALSEKHCDRNSGVGLDRVEPLVDRPTLLSL